MTETLICMVKENYHLFTVACERSGVHWVDQTCWCENSQAIDFTLFYWYYSKSPQTTG